MQCSTRLDSAIVWEPTTLATGPQTQASLHPRRVNTHIHGTPRQHPNGTHSHAIDEGSGVGVVSQPKELLHTGQAEEITRLEGWSEDIGGYPYMSPASHQSLHDSARPCSCNSPYDLETFSNYDTLYAASPVHVFEQHGCRCDVGTGIERQSVACRQSRAAPALFIDDARPTRNAYCTSWALRRHSNMYEQGLIQDSEYGLHSGATRMYAHPYQRLPRCAVPKPRQPHWPLNT